MNTYTNRAQFDMSADMIMSHCELLIKENCIVIDDVVYEKLEQHTDDQHLDNDDVDSGEVKSLQYRFFFSTDDYDYVEDEDMIRALDVIFKTFNKGQTV